MNRIKKRISLALVKSLVTSGEECLVSDTDILGFQVRVAKRSVTFRVRWCKGRGVDRGEKLFTIGHYPGMMPDEARAEALKIVSKLENYESVNSLSARRFPTVGEAMDAYVEHVKNKANAVSVFNHCAHLRSRRIADLLPSDVLAIRDSLLDHPATANLVVKYLSGAISLLIREMNLDLVNPVRGISKLHVEPRKRFLSDSEAPLLLDELSRLTSVPIYSAQADALLMMIYTGARKSNVLSMNLSEIERDVWIIPYNKSKNGKEIIVPLNKFALEIVRKRSEKAIDGYLFTWRGRVLSDVRKTFRTACAAVGVEECRIHDLRRTLGSWMLMNGTPIEVVSKTLGHSSIHVTEQVYAHLLPKKISDATSSAVQAMREGKV